MKKISFNCSVVLSVIALILGSINFSNAQIIRTFAGNGSVGFSGDGGAATAASLYGTTDIAFDVSGNLYVVRNED